MATWTEAKKALREGKQIRRPTWNENSYWILGPDEMILFTGGIPAKIHLKQLSARDWIINNKGGEKC